MKLKKKLSQYNNIKREIKNLEKRIARIDMEKDKIEIDTVTGSDPHFPYEARSFVIEGIGAGKAERSQKLGHVLKNRKNKCEDIKVEIEEFISHIEDSKTRQIFQYRYIDELEWLPISMKFGKVNESYARMIHDRYLERLDS